MFRLFQELMKFFQELSLGKGVGGGEGEGRPGAACNVLPRVKVCCKVCRQEKSPRLIIEITSHRQISKFKDLGHFLIAPTFFTFL
jgi:hypothetical protein